MEFIELEAVEEFDCNNLKTTCDIYTLHVHQIGTNDEIVLFCKHLASCTLNGKTCIDRYLNF